MTAAARGEIVSQEYKLGFHDEVAYLAETKAGLTRATVEEISAIKEEPEWMLQFRLRAYDHFLKRSMPTWVPESVQGIDFGKIVYYRKPSEREEKSWDDVPEQIKQTFEKLGIPEAERKFLAGVGAQYDSEVVYHSVREELSKIGVVFMGMDQGLREHPDLVKKYFATVVPPEDNKFAALNSAVWSGGCLTADAMLFTERGRVSIAEIREGDQVFAATPGGEIVLAPVLAQVNSGTKRVFKLKVAGQELEATANHRFLTLRKSDVRLNDKGLLWAQEWLPLSELQEGDLIAVAKRLPEHGSSRALPPLRPYLRNSHRFASWRAPSVTSPDLMWLLGLWMGDGNTSWVGPHMCHINFALPTEHKGEVRTEAVRVTSELFGYIERPGTQTHVSFTVNSKAIGQWLAEIGFVGSATTKRIPGWVYALPLDERLAFVGGILDSDGYIENQGRTVSFELSNRDLILDIKALSVTCGLYTNGEIVSRTRKPTLFTKEGRHIASQASHRCRLQGDLARIGTRTSVKRTALAEAKREVFDKYRASHGQNFRSQSSDDVGFAPIRSIEEVGEAEVFDIQVQGLENFVANGVVAHNSFVYVPKGVEVPLPLQAYFRINGENTGQFERTLIIADEGSKLHYIEGCSAPIYTTDALHAAVVEVIALPGSKIRYTTIQNWSRDVYNLVTKRAHAHAHSTVEWVDANTGCLTGDSLVYKNNDLVPIAEIEPGDMVYNLTPEFEIGRSRVVGKRENPPEQVYNVVLRNYREVRATANHPFLVARKVGRTRQLAWMSVASIVPGDELAIVGRVPDRGRPHRFDALERRKHSRNPFVAPVESTDELLWVLGFYVGDGFLDGENRVIFAVPATDPACDPLRERLQSVFGVESHRARGVQLRVNSAPLVDWLRAGGFSGDANTKRLPDWIFRIPHSQKRAFVDGYIAADGHIRDGHRNISITSTSWVLLEQVRALAISAGMNATKISTWTRRQKLPLGTHEKSCTTSYLYFGDEPLDGPVHFVPILTIDPAGEHVTYDIEVEGTANFIANGVFVHNSRATVKYPAIYLRGEGATAEVISVAFAGHGQHQDTGAKAVHLAPNTRSRIVSKSVSKDGGRGTYRGTLKVAPGATGVVASVRCDALLLDEESRSDTYPYIDIQEDDTTMTHEATVGKVSADQIFYLMSRGLTENEATNLVVQGFLEVFTKELPMEYAIEFNRLVKMEMEGSLG